MSIFGPKTPQKKKAVVPPMAPRDATAAIPSPALPRHKDQGNVDFNSPRNAPENDVRHLMGGHDAGGFKAPTNAPLVEADEPKAPAKSIPPKHPVTGKFMSVDDVAEEPQEAAEDNGKLPREDEEMAGFDRAIDRRSARIKKEK